MGPAAVEVSLDSIAESADPRPDEAAAETNLASGAAAPASDRPHRRRRRRRPPPAVLGSAPAALGSALPPLDAAPASGIGDAAAPEGSAEDTAGLASEGRSERPALHLRRPVRGRRQLPRPPGLQPGAAENTPALGTAAEGEGLAAAPGGEAPSGTPRPEGEVPRRRRRRRPGPRPPGAAAASETQSLEAPQQFGRPPRGRDRRRGDERSRTAQPDRNRDGQPQRRGPGGGSRDREAGGPGRRERDDRAARGRGPDGRREGQRGRGRDAAPRRVELKLYTLESMVDRGFEDVPDEAEESGSRRVHWTIIKRTVADQKSGKPISTTYVLQREDSETEFPNLGTARAAANKTIIHPEKLTMSKAEHAAAKNSK
ncbi:MAG: hypothetical protein JO007_03530 [Alphaproteobacteria bacterium]|nr:hypothetical protein [Alphaproteobacteria bacterium]